MRGFVADPLVPDISVFSNFMCSDKDSIDDGIYTKSFYVLNCTSDVSLLFSSI